MKGFELQEKLRELANDIIRDPEQLAAFAKKWTNGFHSYSLYNMLLIWFQKRDATLCAGYHKWLSMKRYVKKGEHAIFILAPAFKKTKSEGDDGEVVEEKKLRYFMSVSVFDYSQTEGEPIELGCSEKVTGKTRYEFADVIKLFEYPVEIVAPQMASGSTDGKTITINEAKPLAMLATYFHELAHCMLKHVGSDIDRETRELQAEATSFLVCSYLGIKNDISKYYIGNWKGDKEKLMNSGTAVLRTAEKIIRTLEKKEAKAD